MKNDINQLKLNFFITLKMAMTYFRGFQQEEIEQLECEYDKKIREAVSVKVKVELENEFRQAMKSLKSQHDRLTNTNDFIIKRREKEMKPEGKAYFDGIVVGLGGILNELKNAQSLPQMLYTCQLYNEGKFDEFFKALDKKAEEDIQEPDHTQVTEGVGVPEDIEPFEFSKGVAEEAKAIEAMDGEEEILP